VTTTAVDARKTGQQQVSKNALSFLGWQWDCRIMTLRIYLQKYAGRAEFSACTFNTWHQVTNALTYPSLRTSSTLVNQRLCAKRSQSFARTKLNDTVPLQWGERYDRWYTRIQRPLCSSGNGILKKGLTHRPVLLCTRTKQSGHLSLYKQRKHDQIHS